MKKIIFGILIATVLLISGCSDTTTVRNNTTESVTEKVTAKSTAPSVKPTAPSTKSESHTEVQTEWETEKPTEKPTQKEKKLDLVKNNQKSYISLRNTGIIGKEIFYSSDCTWEYVGNKVTNALPEEIAEYVGKFFVLGDEIYFTPPYSAYENSSIQLWKMKKDGTEPEFVADDLASNVNCVYTDGYIIYNCYSEYNNSNFGVMCLNLETNEKVNYPSISNIQYTYKGIAYYLDGNYIKYLNPKTGDTGLVRNTGGSLICGDTHYLYYLSSGSGKGLFRIDLNNSTYSANEFVKSNVSTSCVAINDVLYYYPANALTTSQITVYDIENAKELSPIDIQLTRKIYRFWNENGYLLFSVQNGNSELNMSDYLVNPDNRKTYKISNYARSVSTEEPTFPYTRSEY